MPEPQVNNHTLSLYAGTQQVHVFSAADVAECGGGTVDQVLDRLIDRHISDPGIRAELKARRADPALTLEIYGVTQSSQDEEPHPDHRESFLYPDHPWEEAVAPKLKEGDAEIGLNRRHKGGHR